MKCIGGSGRGLYDIDIVRCKNSGSDYDSENIQWTCTASLPEEFKLGSTDVICEGYDSPDDPYILKGSCGVEYRLILTDKGEEKYGKKKHWFGDDDEGRDSGDYEKTMGDRVVASLFWLVFIGVALWIVFNAVQGWADRRNFAGGPAAGNRPGWGGGGGGGGWGGGDDNDDPPPPYNPHPDPNYKRSYGGTGNEGWRPGFWSGALGGAAAGYAARNWGNNRNQNNQTGTGWGNSSGRWNNGEGSSRSSSGSSGSPSYSSTRHESTGFGSS
jgi:hypothetical protein